jgi:hypothetical protein
MKLKVRGLTDGNATPTLPKAMQRAVAAYPRGQLGGGTRMPAVQSLGLACFASSLD